MITLIVWEGQQKGQLIGPTMGSVLNDPQMMLSDLTRNDSVA